MIFLLRIAVVFLTGYFLYMVYRWWQENHSPMMPCPQCDGEGTWTVYEDSTASIAEEIEVDCILCNGKGKIEREV